MNEPMVATDVAARVQEILKEELGVGPFETWFSHVTFELEGDSHLDLSAPNSVILEWIRQRYSTEIHAAVAVAAGCPKEIRFSVTPGAVPSYSSNSPEKTKSDYAASSALTAVPESIRTRNATFLKAHSNVLLNEEYSFANFVVGSGNRFSHAAALAVCEDPAQAYNPLFLHGNVGLGKTHLMQAICHGLIEKGKEINVVYLTCENFVNQFISAIEASKLDAFRDKYRQVDVLLIDDVQFLSRKERTQEEFFHTFNALHENKRQIVLSSDRSPREIPNLEDRLVSRFKWGLEAEIHPPDYETRMAIVKKKSKLRGHELPDDVADYISAKIKTNVRELEGAVVKVLGFAALLSRPVDREVAQEALSDGSVIDTPRVTCDRIMDTICHHYEVRKSEIQSKRRMKSIAFPRQIGMYLARKNTNHSLEEIGAYFGNRDHSTVLYAADKIEKLLKDDPELLETVSHLDRKLKSRA